VESGIVKIKGAPVMGAPLLLRVKPIHKIGSAVVEPIVIIFIFKESEGLIWTIQIA
jgi:hypothetical protein